MSEQKMTNASEGKEWSAPQLTVLARSIPEENVLTYCKSWVPSGVETAKQGGCKDANRHCVTCDYAGTS